jgi:hypothetical protein
MVTAVDSSVLVDVLLNDATHGTSSEKALRQALGEGGLVCCECVLAEVTPVLPRADLENWLEDWGLICLPSTKESALLAGEMLRKHFERGGRRGRIAADFLIGAHASVHADRILARDRGFYRDYFKSLKVWDPSA